MKKDDELFHSSTYYGEDFSDGLMHWKYIKRYKGRNGKWVYVYANKDTHTDIQKKKSDVDFFNEEVNNLQTRYDQLKNLKKAYSKPTDNPDNAINRAMKSFEYDLSKDQATLEKNSQEYSTLLEQNSVSNLSKKAIEKGKNFIENLFSKKEKSYDWTSKDKKTTATFN